MGKGVYTQTNKMPAFHWKTAFICLENILRCTALAAISWTAASRERVHTSDVHASLRHMLIL